MTKLELEAKVASLEAERDASKVVQTTVKVPSAGFHITNDNGSSRSVIILTEPFVQQLLDQVVDGHVGMTARFLPNKQCTANYINTFESAKQFGVNMPSAHTLLKQNISYKSGDFTSLIEESNG
tara:strand:+ start:390 stop:761 length:372 start_codon:yes stop_codon:yes gene_type:complete